MYYDDLIVNEYEHARHPGLIKWIKRIMAHKSNKLHDFNHVHEHLSTMGQHDAGIQLVPIDQIVGSVGRTGDFDRQFHPQRDTTRERWMRIARAMNRGEVLPPVELVKLGELYFVVDGNHRISVMREHGQIDVEAHVIVIETGIDIRNTMELRQIISQN